jgi:hypothetical protein
VQVENFIKQPIGLMFRKGSPLIETFNKIIMERLPRINNLLDMKLGKKCHNHMYPEEADPEPGYTPLSVSAVSGVLGLWVFLITVAIIVILFESFWARKTKSDKLVYGANKNPYNIFTELHFLCMSFLKN